MNLDEMDANELRALKKEVDKAISTFEERQMAQAREKLEAHAREMGYTLNDFSAARKPRAINPPKYRNPKDPLQTWTGRGRKPGWILKAIEHGEDLDNYLI